ncbi:MAG: hypothetical protein LBK53_05780 [Heliobacteriaceae bacterium]|jgi:hypothetical protein|nr:hypothetical protein [Heliobacteriaceae bacterium]
MENLESLKDEKLVAEITNLVNTCEKFESTLDDYCKFMKDMFLSNSGNN